MLLGPPPSFLRTKLSHTSSATRFPRSRQPPSVQTWLRPSFVRSSVSLNVFACTAPTIQLNPRYQALPTTVSTCIQQSCSTYCPQHTRRICEEPCVLWIIDRVLYNRYIDIHTFNAIPNAYCSLARAAMCRYSIPSSLSLFVCLSIPSGRAAHHSARAISHPTQSTILIHLS